jgi:hypothetical protein
MFNKFLGVIILIFFIFVITSLLAFNQLKINPVANFNPTLIQDQQMARDCILSEVKWADSQTKPSNQEINAWSDNCLGIATAEYRVLLQEKIDENRN